MVALTWRAVGRGSLAGGALALGLLGGGEVRAVEPAAKAVYSFSALKAMPADKARPQLEKWLKAKGKFDADRFAALWADGKGVPDATLAAIEMGMPEVGALLNAAKNDPNAPLELPALVKDESIDPFVRANVAAAYAKALAGRKVYEESLAAAKLATPELLVDPASYFFYRAVSEHALIQRDAAVTSISRLLDDVADVPDRYRVVATLLFFDVQNWAKDDKDLSNITRLMDNSGRRLELARGGKETQAIQKKIVFRLDEKIKELEAKAKSQGQGGKPCENGGSCPSGAPGSQPGSASGPPNKPQDESYGGNNSGPGAVDAKKLRQYEQVWGTLPEAERKKITQDFVRDMPPKFKPMIDSYFASLNRMYGYK